MPSTSGYIPEASIYTDLLNRCVHESSRNSIEILGVAFGAGNTLSVNTVIQHFCMAYPVTLNYEPFGPQIAYTCVFVMH